MIIDRLEAHNNSDFSTAFSNIFLGFANKIV